MPEFYFDVPGVRNATVSAATEAEARNLLDQNIPDTVQWGEFDPTGSDSVVLVDTDGTPESTPDFVVTVTRTFTINIFGDVPGYIELANSLGERLDSMDPGDATGAIVKAVTDTENGALEHSAHDTRVVASYEDYLYEWNPTPRP